MNPNRREQIEKIFQMAAELSSDRRARFIADKCGGDDDLQYQVEKLLAENNSAESFIESHARAAGSRFLNTIVKKDSEVPLDTNSTENKFVDSMIGRRIGAYVLKQELGRGGMGAVYLAERADGEFSQKVAVKLIKRGMDTDFILSRFRHERQILAGFNHPNIVLLLDGGTTDDGLPYFVMDFVEGESLHKYCDKHNLDLRERLELFRQVCEAVDYAHQKRIVHRDLKPSNILVNRYGIPKLLDFGIAKLLDADQASDTLMPTATQMRLLTPEYASPEQVRGADITPLSDVYSLGVLLYELLTGVRPYKFPRRAAAEIARVVCEVAPAPLLINSLLAVEKNARDKVKSEKQGTDELENIVFKALRKEPSERYETALALALDISNYLENRPVNAERFTSDSATKKISENRSIAVLPFNMLGIDGAENTDDIFLGIGLADALVSRLSGVQRLVVRPTSSALQFGGENPVDAGDKLGVDFVLDGTIRRIGARIRVSVQLLNVAESSTRWAEKFDENFTDVLEIEDLISERVAKSLLPQLTGEERRRLEKRGTNNPLAYRAFLRGRYFWNKFTGADLLKAIEEFQNALDFDPEYALPHVGIADFYIWSSIFGEIPSKEAYPKAKRAAERALEIDDSFGEAYAILAFTNFIFDWNWEEAERLIGRALELSPNYSFAHECYSNFLTAQGRFDEGIREIKIAEELDPISPRAKLMTSWTLYMAGKYDEGIIKAEQAKEMQKNFPQAFLHLGNCLSLGGRLSEAIEALSESARLWDNSGLPKYMLCFALAADGQIEAARSTLNGMLAKTESGYLKPYFVAMAYAALNERDAAFAWFEKSIEARDEWMIWFGTEPKLDFLRNDKRYHKLLERTNNPITARDARPETGETTTAKTGKSIAVLPFKLLGTGNANDPEDEFLSVGLADALTMRLSNVRRFLVRPTSSVLPFGNHGYDPFAAGRELGVEFVIDGNIRRVADRVRVAVQLLDVGANSTHWAARFDERAMDVLALEDSISERVTVRLLPHLTGEERRQLARRGTNNAEAHEAYLRGRFFWNQFTPETLTKARELFEKAVSLDPEYALAYAGIADFYNWATIFGLFPPIQSAPKVFAAANRAIELDPKLAEGYAALGLYHSNQWNWANSEKFYRRALEINPNYPLAHEWFSTILTGTGRFEEGVKEIKLAEQLDPLSLRAKTMTAWTLYQSGRFEECLEKGREIVELDGDFSQGHFQIGNALLELGRVEEALESCRKALALMPDSPMPIYLLCFALAANEKTAEAGDYLLKLKNIAAKMYVSSYFLAMSHLAIGEISAAFEFFEQTVVERSPWVIWFGTDPKLKVIRDDPRLHKLLTTTRNPIFNFSNQKG